MLEAMLARVLEYLWPRRVPIALLFVGILLPLLILGQLAAEVHYQGGLPFDRSTLHWLHAHADARWDYWVAWATLMGRVLAVPAVCAVTLAVWWLLKQPRNAALFLVAVLGGWSLNLLSKAFFQRSRPGLWASVSPETSYSFPSGHAMMSTVIASVLMIALWDTRMRWPALAGAVPCVLLISGSRLYLGVHFPSDILAGWCAGAAWVVGVWWIVGRRLARPSLNSPP